MRIATDGTVPVERMVLVNAFQTDDGLRYTLAEPLFLRPGDRVRHTPAGLTVERATGEILHPEGGFAWHCRGRGVDPGEAPRPR